MAELLIEEVRLNRFEIAELRKELSGLKVSVGVVGAFFGTLGAVVVKVWTFLNHK